MKFLYSILICSLILTRPMLGQDHLEPTQDIFWSYPFEYDYHSKIRTILLDSLRTPPDVQIVITPSFSEESVWQLIHSVDENEYYSFYRTGSISIWYNNYSDKPKKVKLIPTDKALSKETFETIKNLYKAAIYTVRYTLPDGTMGMDGTSYYFGVFDEGPKTGTIWSPKADTKMGRLVSISNELMELASKPGNRLELGSKLILDIEKLTKELK